MAPPLLQMPTTHSCPSSSSAAALAEGGAESGAALLQLLGQHCEVGAPPLLCGGDSLSPSIVLSASTLSPVAEAAAVLILVFPS